MRNIITTKNLCKQYGENNSVVKDLDLNVKEGCIYGFLGPNGAGKSTTLKMLLGLAKPTSGTISMLGQEMNTKNRLSVLKNVGSLIESPSYYGHLTGEENLRIFQTLRDVPSNRITEVLQIVRLQNQKSKKVSEYSLGMKQRLGIATALLANPKLLILDEPTNGLDPAGIGEMRELITTLPSKYGMSVVVSSHLLSEIDQIAEEVGIIRQGELVFQDSLAALHSRDKKQLAIRTLNNATASKLIKAHNISCLIEDDFIILPDLDDFEVAKYNALLMQNNIGIVRIEERKRTLEDIFLELTGMAVSL
ncbi:MAG: ABC transporter ATP-binding protein [Cellulosilyticaceae bacterium]